MKTAFLNVHKLALFFLESYCFVYYTKSDRHHLLPYVYYGLTNAEIVVK
ncbi:hypothetical protein [Fischerella sp. JS2]|nr:hypothetical protein [Fischerella sp. JS2]